MKHLLNPRVSLSSNVFESSQFPGEAIAGQRAVVLCTVLFDHLKVPAERPHGEDSFHILHV